MRFYIISAFFIIVTLLGLVSYRQDIFHMRNLQYDDEQQRLNEQIIINFSHVVAENTPKGIAAAKFAQLVEEKSAGHIVVEIHPNGILYNDETELQALQNGTIQMIAPTISKMTDKLPDWQVLDLPFVIETNEQTYAALNGKLSEKLLDELKQIEVKGLTFWNNGFKQIATKDTPVLEVEQFKGLRIRTMPSDILSEQFRLVGATPIVTTFNDLYSQLANDEVTAQENTISNIYSKGFYETQNEITLSQHGVLAYSVMMNFAFWESLTSKNQHIILEALDEMKEWQHHQAIQMNEENLKALQLDEEIHIYTLTSHQMNQWKLALQPIYQMVEKEDYELLKQEIQNVQNDQK